MLRLSLDLEMRPKLRYNCFVCLNRNPSQIQKASNKGKYPNGWQDFYYCDDDRCVKKYAEMHREK